MYLHELEDIFHPECTSKSLAELRKQICSKRRSASGDREEHLSAGSLEAISAAFRASVMNESFLYAVEALFLYVNNLEAFIDNGISFARYISNIENFFANVNHIEFAGSIDLGILGRLKLREDSKLLSDVAFICPIIASSYRDFLTLPAADTDALIDSIRRCFSDPIEEILSTIATSTHGKEELDEEELDAIIDDEIANFAQITLLPISNLLRIISTTKDKLSGTIRPNQVELPSEREIAEEAGKPICDGIDVFVADHVEFGSTDDKLLFTRLYRESLSSKGISTDKSDLGSLFLEASLVLAKNRSLALKFTA